MTVASEISRLDNAKANIKASIENKWVSVPGTAKLDAYPGYIDQIKHNDYSCWTLAYWLKATTSLPWYSNWWLCTQYSEINDDWTVSWIFSANGHRWSDNYDCMGFHFLGKRVWCMPTWSSTYCCILDSRSYTRFFVYAHKSNPDCFLINRVYCESYSWSWWAWQCSQYYYREGIDFSVPCMSCVWSWAWCCTWDCCWSLDCDKNPPSSDYKYIWTSISNIGSCRWNKPSGILCTTIESSDSNNYVWAAVFK